MMPNHVHLLVTPTVTAKRWRAPLKGFTAGRANDMPGSRGQAFRQDESYDHSVRSEAEFDCIQSYIEENPVKAGLVGRLAAPHL